MMNHNVYIKEIEQPEFGEASPIIYLSVGIMYLAHFGLRFEEGINEKSQAGCIGMKSSGNQHISLSNPVGSEIKKGEFCSTNITYWRANICRFGWVAEDENDLSETTKRYVNNFASRYFKACKSIIYVKR